MVFAYMACAVVAFFVYRVSQKLPHWVQMSLTILVFVALSAMVLNCQRKDDDFLLNADEPLLYESP